MRRRNPGFSWPVMGRSGKDGTWSGSSEQSYACCLLGLDRAPALAIDQDVLDPLGRLFPSQAVDSRLAFTTRLPALGNCLPARFRDPGDQAVAGQVAEADA